MTSTSTSSARVNATGSPSIEPSSAQGPADLGQAPAQRPQRVVRLGEEQLRETLPGSVGRSVRSR